jgi:type VI secretion system protein ImpH
MSFFEDLAREPWRFDFFDVLRSIERAAPDRPRIGDAGARDEELLVLGQDPYLEFPASNLTRLDRDVHDRIRLLCRFAGLLGPQGPLPLHLTIEARQWCDARDESFARFLDIFNHRFLALFYRAWADARPAAQHDRPEEDRFIDYVGTVTGMGTKPYRHRDSLGDLAKLPLAGLMGPAVKSASRVENMVAFLFSADVEVEQMVGLWLTLEAADQSSLSARHAKLGTDTLLGGSVYSVQDKFRIRIFAKTLGQFEAFLPDGAFCEKLADAIYFYLGDLLDYDVEIAIPERETRPASIGGFGRLGWTTWMTDAGEPDRAGWRRDCRFRPAERAGRKQSSTRRASADGRNSYGGYQS